MEDVKSHLNSIYHGKCAYCEKDENDSYFHVEHYRPKSVYYWLAFSWDNLLLCCDKCNACKDVEFELDGDPVEWSADDLDDIHNLTHRYNELERPRLVHPELENVEERLIFTEKGDVDSANHRVKYTIQTCGIDRKSANERRKKIFDDFLKKYRSKIFEYQKSESMEALGALRGLITDFLKDAKNPRNEYLAFRSWIINNTKYFHQFISPVGGRPATSDLVDSVFALRALSGNVDPSIQIIWR